MEVQRVDPPPTHTKDKIFLWERALVGLKCQPISEFGEPLVDLRRRMLEVCTRYNGVGLAAPQIGINLRVVLINFETTTKLLVNPEIEKRGSQSIMMEGCLSIPGAHASGLVTHNRGRVARPDEIFVNY